jgi:hypothetical protein
LQKAVRELNESHRSSGLFTVEVFFWEDIADLLQEYTDIRDPFYAPISDHRASAIQAGIDVLNRGMVQLAAMAGAGGQAAIDKAVEALQAGDWYSCRRDLTALKDTRWELLSQDEQFRVLANLGHTYEQEGNLAIAANFFCLGSA